MSGLSIYLSTYGANFDANVSFKGKGSFTHKKIKSLKQILQERGHKCAKSQEKQLFFTEIFFKEK